jgi:anti-anti-sigma factor
MSRVTHGGTPEGDWPSGSITLERDGAGSVLRLTGDVDAPVVEQFEAANPDTVPVDVVDVGDMTYIDSSGLGFLVRWARAASGSGQPPVLRRPTRRFDQVLDLTGLTPLFPRRE